ncbi:hypothetical protein, partial [Streptomyces fradiae]
MLPAEPPLALHLRPPGPVPPERRQAVSGHPAPAPEPAPAHAVVAGTAPAPARPAGPALLAGQDGVGNAAVAAAALRTPPP